MAETSKSQTKKCRFFWTEKGCHHENMCKFDHVGTAPSFDKKKKKKGDGKGVALKMSPEPRFYPMCIYWEKGSCDNGDECRFRHSKDPKAGPAFMVNAQCHRCEGKGHMTDSCSKPCAKCKTMDHVGRKCIECHYCREWGHHYNACPNYCTECKAVTHNWRECPYMSKRNKASATTRLWVQK